MAQFELPDVRKTFKLFINGKFSRSESGRFKVLKDPNGAFLANFCMASKKDLRDAVGAARAAQSSWQDRSAYNKSQILYRIAEMLESRKEQFVNEMMAVGYTHPSADLEFCRAKDLVVYYAGWCDKYIQVYSSVNPVASSHFNFSWPEPMGVVGTLCSNGTAFIGMVQAILPAICGGNTVVALASEMYPMSAITFAETLATSDVPDGIVNILTGSRQELGVLFASHRDADALNVWDVDADQVRELGVIAADSVKRLKVHATESKEVLGSPDYIMHLQEIKTTWHPIDHSAGVGAAY